MKRPCYDLFSHEFGCVYWKATKKTPRKKKKTNENLEGSERGNVQGKVKVDKERKEITFPVLRGRYGRCDRIHGSDRCRVPIWTWFGRGFAGGPRDESEMIRADSILRDASRVRPQHLRRSRVLLLLLVFVESILAVVVCGALMDKNGGMGAWTVVVGVGRRPCPGREGSQDGIGLADTCLEDRLILTK